MLVWSQYDNSAHHGRVSSVHIIKEWVRKFEDTGSAENVKRKGPKQKCQKS